MFCKSGWMILEQPNCNYVLFQIGELLIIYQIRQIFLPYSILVLEFCCSMQDFYLPNYSEQKLRYIYIFVLEMNNLQYLDISYNILNDAICHVPISFCLHYINLTSVISHDPLPVVSLLESKLQHHVSHDICTDGHTVIVFINCIVTFAAIDGAKLLP